MLRSAYISYWLPELHKLQVEIVAFLMCFSLTTAQTHYLKQVEEIKEEEEPQQQINNTNKVVLKTEEEKETKQIEN